MTLTSRVQADSARRTLALVAGLALALALLPLAGTAQAQDPPPNAPCPDDVPLSDFIDRDSARSVHERSIDCVAFHRISVGATDRDGNSVYLPAGIVNRGQMATFIANTLEAAGLELPEGDGEDEFTDTEGNTHRERINSLARAGIVQGRTPDLYRPLQQVTRAQMATFIVQAAEWAFDDDLEAEDGPWFEDAIGTAHEENIDAGFEYGLFEGRVAPTEDTLGIFDTRSGTRRDQMATFLSRLLDFIWIEQGIFGAVIDAEDDEPIAGADVTITDGDGDAVVELTTGDSGLFLAELDAGTYDVTAEAEGYEEATETDVVVVEGEITEVVLALTAEDVPLPQGISGTVTEDDDENGDPIANATVTASVNDQEFSTSTGEDGTYELPLEVGTYDVTADADGYDPETETGVEVAADTFTDLDFELSPEVVEPTPSATLTADRELAPVSETADPGNDFPSPGDVNFELTAFDADGDEVTTGLTYEFTVTNTGDADVVACVRCAAPDNRTIAAGETETFDAAHVEGRERVRVDAAAPTSVEVTGSTVVEGETVTDTATATWVAVDAEPTGGGEAADFSGTVAAFNTGEDHEWYLINAGEDDGYVLVGYTGGADDTYLIEGVGATEAEFAAALALDLDIDYETDADDVQTHDLSPVGNDGGAIPNG